MIAAWGLVALAAAAASGVQLPSGTELHVRLKTKLVSNASKAKEPFEAMVIVPVITGGQIVVPGGAKLDGVVHDIRAAAAGQQALLDLGFTDLVIGQAKLPLAAKVSDVDNAREIIDQNGRILGIFTSETISGRIDQGIAKVQEKYSGLAEVLQAAKGAFVKEAAGDIDFEPGVEMTLKLTAPLKIPQEAISKIEGPKLATVAHEAALVAMVNSQPFQTMAAQPRKPSDVTNVMYIGTEAQLTSAFQAAGWSTAAALDAKSKMETARAIIEDRGYKEAPVSILLLDERPPDLVFQKQNDTFAQRHHLRIWRRPVTFDGKPVWVCSATHDTGIDFSEQNRTFIHKIDPNIDKERAKVVNDLLLTGQVKSLELVERPQVPKHSQNATGDNLDTDAAMAVVIF